MTIHLKDFYPLCPSRWFPDIEHEWLLFITILLLFLSALSQLSFSPTIWQHFSLSLSLLFPPTQPTYSFIPTLCLSYTLSTPFQLFAHLLFSPALHWYSVCACVCFSLVFYFRTTSTLPPTSGLPVCSAQLHHTHLSVQQDYNVITIYNIKYV